MGALILLSMLIGRIATLISNIKTIAAFIESVRKFFQSADKAKTNGKARSTPNPPPVFFPRPIEESREFMREFRQPNLPLPRKRMRELIEQRYRKGFIPPHLVDLTAD